MENAEKKTRGKRGQGSVYRPKNSRFWRVKFSVHGRVINESAETESKRDALKAKMLKYSTGRVADSRQTTVKDISEGMLTLGECSKGILTASNGQIGVGVISWNFLEA